MLEKSRFLSFLGVFPGSIANLLAMLFLNANNTSLEYYGKFLRQLCVSFFFAVGINCQ